MAITVAKLAQVEQDIDDIMAWATTLELQVIDRLEQEKPSLSGVIAAIQARLDAAMDEADGTLTLLKNEAAASAAAALDSLHAAQALASGTFAPTAEFAGNGPWALPAGAVPVDLFVNGQRWRLSGVTVAGNVVTNTSSIVLAAGDLVDIKYVIPA